MVLEKDNSRNYRLEEEREDIIKVRLNPGERRKLEELKICIQQEKDATAIKQLAFDIAPNVVQDKKVMAINEVVLNNYRKNKRLGIVTFD